MNSLVVYASHFGSTRQVAESIAAGLKQRGAVAVVPADAASVMPGIDLLVVGGPTEGHRMTKPMSEFLRRIDPKTVAGMSAVAFDTRVGWPRWLAGSAGTGIRKRLERAGARIVAPEESFFVAKVEGAERGEPARLVAGELERATAWGEEVAERVQQRLQPA